VEWRRPLLAPMSGEPEPWDASTRFPCLMVVAPPYWFAPLRVSGCVCADVVS